MDAALSRLELEIEEQDKELLLQHLFLVIEKNKVLNLTRITSVEEAIVLHIEDSLAAYPEFSSVEGMFCDIGTGGGFPGIPLGIVSRRNGVLLDSVKKKANAVQGFIEELSLDKQLTCLGCRSEEHAHEQPESYSTVIGRAVASLNVLQELATPLLADGGTFISMRSAESDEQKEAASKAADVLGLELESLREFKIGPEEKSFDRSVYVYRKVKEAKITLPRRPGMATKKPLGI